jgi:hypothetical protein
MSALSKNVKVRKMRLKSDNTRTMAAKKATLERRKERMRKMTAV